MLFNIFLLKAKGFLIPRYSPKTNKWFVNLLLQKKYQVTCYVFLQCQLFFFFNTSNPGSSNANVTVTQPTLNIFDSMFSFLYEFKTLMIPLITLVQFSMILNVINIQSYIYEPIDQIFQLYLIILILLLLIIIIIVIKFNCRA